MRFPNAAQWVLLSMALVVGPLSSDGWGKPSFPPQPWPRSFVSDAAGLITAEDSHEINRLAGALRRDGYPVGVVTIRSLAGQGAEDYTIEEYASELLQSWRVDEAVRGNAMLLVVAAEDREARIELGAAWGRAHDDRARDVMNRLILPAFRRGEFSAGILAGVRGFDAMGRQLALPSAPQPWWMLPALVAAGLVAVAGLVSVGRNGRRSWAWAAGAFVLGIVLARTFGWASASDSGGGATGEW
jgi:uncharacterized protein